MKQKYSYPFYFFALLMLLNFPSTCGGYVIFLNGNGNVQCKLWCILILAILVAFFLAGVIFLIIIKKNLTAAWRFIPAKSFDQNSFTTIDKDIIRFLFEKANFMVQTNYPLLEIDEDKFEQKLDDINSQPKKAKNGNGKENLKEIH